MSGRILIIDSDEAHAASLRSPLESQGLTVEVLTDARGCVEHVRQTRPDLVVLAVELSGGQNGYLICGKLKKDDALKSVPIVITGNPDGFAAHRKLKARADEYVARPVDPNLLVERVGALLHRPQGAARPRPEGSGQPPSLPSEPPWLLIGVALVVAGLAGAWLLF